MATITPEQRDDVLKVVVGLFNAAPGGLYLNDLAANVEGGMSIRQLSDFLASHPIFINEVLAGKVTVDSKVNLLMKNFGLTADSDPASAGSQAAAYFKANLEAGKGFGEIVNNAVTYLKNPAPEFQHTATLLNNKILVSNAYSLNNSSTDLSVLQNVLVKVTGDSPYTPTDVANILAGVTQKTSTLAIGEDKLTGTDGDDTFIASVVQSNNGTPTDSLESIDTVDGGAGNDTLTATIATGNPAPTLKSIETVNLRFTAANTVDLTNASGVTAVTVGDSTTAANVKGVGSASTLGVSNQVQNVTFADSTATTLGLMLDAVPLDSTGAIKTVVDLGSTKATTLNVTAKNANIEVKNAGAVATLTVAATGTNSLKLTNDAATVTSATVTGAGSVDFTSVAFSGALTKFDASANSGGVKADLASTKAVAVSSGDGADTIKFSGAQADSSATLGKGDDTLFTGALLDKLNKGADGGEGTDIINIADGAKLDATTSKYITNFETLDVSGGKGDYDVSLNGIATTQIDEALGGALTGAVKFIEAPDTFVLNIISKAKTGADFAVGQTIDVELADDAGTTAKGTGETFTLSATINDGNKDDAADGNIDANKVTVAGVENIAIVANTAATDGGSTGTVAADHELIVELVAAAAETLKITGDASVDLSAVTTIGVVSKVDASGSKGDVTIDLSTHAKTVAYTGSEGVDTYTASTLGDNIYTGKGADDVTLTAGKRDTFVLKAITDSQVTDTSGDKKVTLGADTGFDVINAFVAGGTSTTDRIDLTNGGFTGVQRGVVDVTSKVDATTDITSIADLFNDVAGDRAVAYTNIGADVFFFVDANKDGNFTAADDIVGKLVGVTAISEVDINF